MARRAHLRISIRIDVKFFCNDRVYSGTVRNISEKGMFITTDEICIPESRHFDLTIPLDRVTARVPVKINRMINVEEGSYGLGVELLNPPPQYIEYIENLLLLM